MMGQPGTQTFAPDLGDVYTTMTLCGVAVIALVAVAYWLSRVTTDDPRRKVLLPMLAYFMALLALMGFLGSFWSVFKYPTIDITATEFIVGNEHFATPRQHEIRLENYTSSGLGDGGRVLLIQTRDRRTWAFPEERYAINDMLRLLKRK